MEEKQISQIPLIIPAYEPDDRLIVLLGALKEANISPIILVNDGSGPAYDHYYETAEQEYQCIVLKHAVNWGKGRALKTAFNYVLNQYPEAIGCVTADSDGQHTPKDILACMDALHAHPDKLVLGARDFSGEDVPAKSKFGNTLTKKICKWLCGINIADTQTGLRAIPTDFMRDLLNVKGERFEFETRMLIASKDRYPIHEIAIETVYDSKENHQTHFHPIKDSLRIYKIFGAQFLNYILSSASSFVIDILLFAYFCGIFEPLTALYYATVATVLARVISATYNYFINYKFVFNSHEKHLKSTGKYVALCLVQMIASASFVTLGVWVLPSFIHETVIKLVVDTILFCVNFVVQRDFVFKNK